MHINKMKYSIDMNKKWELFAIFAKFFYKNGVKHLKTPIIACFIGFLLDNSLYFYVI
jgi:hypothetical protein